MVCRRRLTYPRYLGTEAIRGGRATAARGPLAEVRSPCPRFRGDTVVPVKHKRDELIADISYLGQHKV
jgi:hypothetical protein